MASVGAGDESESSPALAQCGLRRCLRAKMKRRKPLFVQEKMLAVRRARRVRLQELLAGWPRRDQTELGRLLGRLNDAICDAEHRSPHDTARPRPSEATG